MQIMLMNIMTSQFRGKRGGLINLKRVNKIKINVHWFWSCFSLENVLFLVQLFEHVEGVRIHSIHLACLESTFLPLKTMSKKKKASEFLKYYVDVLK